MTFKSGMEARLMPPGRPSEYRPEFVEQAQKLCELGATDTDLADFFAVDQRTINRWKHSHPEFCQSLKVGKVAADERVTRSLYHRAVGYRQPAVKIFMPGGADKPVYAPYEEEIAPDTTAAIFWLKNRRSQEWRDRTVNVHTDADGGNLELPSPRKLALAFFALLSEARLADADKAKTIDHLAGDRQS